LSEHPDKCGIPARLSVSVISIGELRTGVLTAQSVDARARRLATLRVAESLEPLPVDDKVADAWATLAARLRAAGRKAPVNENWTWIAATAIAHHIPIATQDADYDGLPGVSVIRL
jgi:predicted nucleic acid-binding protein